MMISERGSSSSGSTTTSTKHLFVGFEHGIELSIEIAKHVVDVVQETGSYDTTTID